MNYVSVSECLHKYRSMCECDGVKIGMSSGFYLEETLERSLREKLILFVCWF